MKKQPHRSLVHRIKTYQTLSSITNSNTKCPSRLRMLLENNQWAGIVMLTTSSSISLITMWPHSSPHLINTHRNLAMWPPLPISISIRLLKTLWLVETHLTIKWSLANVHQSNWHHLKTISCYLLTNHQKRMKKTCMSHSILNRKKRKRKCKDHQTNRRRNSRRSQENYGWQLKLVIRCLLWRYFNYALTNNSNKISTVPIVTDGHHFM